MKRFIAWFAVCAILMGNMGMSTSAQTLNANLQSQEQQNGVNLSSEDVGDNSTMYAGARTGESETGVTGTFALNLHFVCPEKIATIGQKKLQVTLLNADGQEAAVLPLTGEPVSLLQTGNGITVNSTYLNEHNVEITTEELIYFMRAEFEGLTTGEKYSVKITGEGYSSYTSDFFSLTAYSKEMVLSTGSSVLSLGDVNRDGKLTKEDMEAAKNALSRYNAAADINDDGVVDITDITYINRQLYMVGNNLGGAEIFDTDIIAESMAAVEESGLKVAEGSEGAVEDLLKDGLSVTLESTNKDKTIKIPIQFSENSGEELKVGQIAIVSPQVDGAVTAGTAAVVYEENGELVTEEFLFSNETEEGVHHIYRTPGQSRVVISLGKQVAVKRIIITVEKVQGSDKAEFAVIDKIQFLKDIVPDNLNTDSSVPKGLKATPGDGQVTLSWNKVNNVTGYLVRYGSASGSYTMEAATETNEVSISGLKNLENYYFTVNATSGEWQSAASEEVEAMPEPESVPFAPGGVSLGVQDGALQIKWGKTKNATGYHVYYKETGAKDFTRADAEGVTELGYLLDGLTNGQEYTISVSAFNSVGEGSLSTPVAATPVKQEVVIPQIPTLHRIDNSEIASVTRENPNNVQKDQYPDGYSDQFVIDGDYDTHWTARAWWESSGFTFELNEGMSHTMDYLVYVPRIDGSYKNSLYQYKIMAWNEAGDQILNYNSNGPSLDVQSRVKGYAVLTFPKTEDIHKIYVKVTQWNGSPTNISLSEIAFYDYYSLNDRIAALFTDNSYTRLADGVTEAQIADLEAEINDSQGFFVDGDIMKDEIGLARSLFQNNTSALGRVLDGVESRNTTGDIKVINTFQPLGVVANAGSKMIIYAQIPEGEQVKIVPTQYYAEAVSWAGSAITLKSGRNEITMPQLTSIAAEKGGALYLQYSGNRQDEIKIQVRGSVQTIPVLELADFASMTEQESRSVIESYVEELTSYYDIKLYGKMGGKPETYVRNSTEISLPNVLLSLPASQVYNALHKVTSLEEKVDMLYQNTLAWQELISVLYRTHGIDDPSKEHSRQNIRYARMTGGAFMYASGAHIGIGYGSAAALVQGKPVEVTGAGNTNRLYGWGIAHEIGHVLDTLGKAETTNNIYSLFGQTYDGQNNSLTSRLEGGKYEEIFRKTAVGAKGIANNVFVSLGMYWQLHLAYDGEGDNFYNRLNKAYRAGAGEGLRGDEKFAVVASEIADRDLTEFFTRWGVELGNEAKARMAAFTPETRNIWYLSDASRRAALKGTGTNITGTPMVSVQTEGRTVTISISGMTGEEQLQGYEISRNGKVIGFTTTSSYVDEIGSANNIGIQYTVKAVDVLGNVVGTGNAQEFMFSVNDFISRSFWSSELQPDGSWMVTFSGDHVPEVSGIFIKGKAGSVVPADGMKENSVSMADAVSSGNLPSTSSSDAEEGKTIISVSLDGSSYQRVFDREISVKEEDAAYLFYGNADNGSIGFYQAATLVIQGLPEDLTPADIELIAYPGDSIVLNDQAVGILEKELRYGEAAEDCIPAGTMIVTGTYTGDPVYNTIRVTGRFESYEDNSLEGTTVERPINGEVILFAPVTEGVDMSEIHNGIWIFIPNVQKEQELAEGSCGLSALPSQIRAQLFRTDDPESADSMRQVANTLWQQTPELESMPHITIE